MGVYNYVKQLRASRPVARSAAAYASNIKNSGIFRRVPPEWRSFLKTNFQLITGIGIEPGDTATARSGNTQPLSMDDAELPSPDITGNAFLQIVQNCKTTRQYAAKSLSPQDISNVLYAAYGINRPKSGQRTAPSAHDWQYVDVYAADERALYLFNPVKPSLQKILDGDIRHQTGLQEYPASAPLNLIYVVDYAKMASDETPDTQTLFGIATVGAIMQNVNLYAASVNMVSGVRADIDRSRLRKTMMLNDARKIILAQSFGYPR